MAVFDPQRPTTCTGELDGAVEMLRETTGVYPASIHHGERWDPLTRDARRGIDKEMRCCWIPPATAHHPLAAVSHGCHDD